MRFESLFQRIILVHRGFEISAISHKTPLPPTFQAFCPVLSNYLLVVDNLQKCCCTRIEL